MTSEASIATAAFGVLVLIWTIAPQWSEEPPRSEDRGSLTVKEAT